MRTAGRKRFNTYGMGEVLMDGRLDIFYAYDGGFFTRITGAADYAAALKVAQGCVSDEIGRVYQKWDPTGKKWK